MSAAEPSRAIRDRLRAAGPRILAALVLLPVVAVVWQITMVSADSATAIPPPAADAAASGNSAKAVVAGGCFWGVQGVFQHVKGVTGAVSGYAGGSRETAHYELVGSGRTGHAESVEITFDPQQISYGRILQIFFSVAHDPTQLDQQGPDFGPQYRSAIFPTDDEQRRVAEAYIAQLDKAGVFRRPIATRIEPFTGFHPAEAYHQDYMTRHPDAFYIVINDQPKLEALKNVFPDRYRETPVLVSRATN